MNIIDIFIDEYNNSLSNTTIDNDIEFMNPFILIPALCGGLAITILCCYSCGGYRHKSCIDDAAVDNNNINNERILLIYNKSNHQNNQPTYKTIEQPPPYVTVSFGSS